MNTRTVMKECKGDTYELQLVIKGRYYYVEGHIKDKKVYTFPMHKKKFAEDHFDSILSRAKYFSHT